jgi:hypothetical protein
MAVQVRAYWFGAAAALLGLLAGLALVFSTSWSEWALVLLAAAAAATVFALL